MDQQNWHFFDFGSHLVWLSQSVWAQDMQGFTKEWALQIQNAEFDADSQRIRLGEIEDISPLVQVLHRLSTTLTPPTNP